MMNLRKIDFLLYERVSKHITVLETCNNIKMLATITFWCMDGLFKIMPEWNQKLLSIHDLVSGNLVAAVNCFSTCKDIRTCGLIFQPDFILNAQIQGCYFYFCQVVLRNVLERGRNVQYSQKMIHKEK
ncbi:hypothetical protein T11_4460 [Trichinella zimbabwensis]|uniref:Uncharacterized protein n=1 Tax=Trichinella zimbabwensis TaxID=268475 RepID=A0A0V1HGD9_9BILA|nr:hypothetical protein T11_4460 [Trichinella zimbabwensis]